MRVQWNVEAQCLLDRPREMHPPGGTFLGDMLVSTKALNTQKPWLLKVKENPPNLYCTSVS